MPKEILLSITHIYYCLVSCLFILYESDAKFSSTNRFSTFGTLALKLKFYWTGCELFLHFCCIKVLGVFNDTLNKFSFFSCDIFNFLIHLRGKQFNIGGTLILLEFLRQQFKLNNSMAPRICLEETCKSSKRMLFFF
ncbi:uncharacterized protein PRCAT00001422001 [Priceomyces carsonii]|uniref:uncharacterized protein n=1 Tax=Priceomyces carsonii TaxID=28549 RepID=UPI002ED9A97D|nr:unnamed protein product [Priceomyces carsonii]